MTDSVAQPDEPVERVDVLLGHGLAGQARARECHDSTS